MKSPIELFRSLLADVGRLEPDAQGLDRDLVTVEQRIEHEGDSFLTVTLPTLCDALDRGLANGQFTCPRGFKAVRGGAIPRIFSGMLCKVFDTITGRVLGHPDVSVIVSIRQLTGAFRKMFQSDKHDDLLDRAAKERFIQDDLSCESSYKLDERQEYILDRVSRSVLLSLDGFDEREIVCKHGPGAVFEKLTPNQKWKALLTYSNQLEYMGFDCFYSRDGVLESEFKAQGLDYGASGDVARLISVPKNTTSRRTITIEPVVRQFVQQGLNTVLREEISRCAVLSLCLDLTNQGFNQKLALEGSLTGEWATLDLKSASDRLSIKAVEQVFRHRPAFLKAVLGCRSPFVMVGKTRLLLKKFAGMGNATTFPIQSVVFACLAMAALLEDKRPSYREVKRVARLVRVFGDDIIVPSASVPQVVRWLTAAGLVVNERKSFTVGNFRESCGVDAFAGVDVTPVYVRQRPSDTSRKEPATIAHYVALSNQLWLRGYYALAATCQTIAEKALKRRLPLTSSTCGGLGLHNRLEATENQRWSSSLHRYEINAPMLVSLKRKDEIDGYAALLKFFHRPSPALLGKVPMPVSIDDDHLRESPIRFQLRIVSRWVPTH